MGQILILISNTDGFTRIWPTIGTVCAMIISLAFLGFPLKSLPVGTAYAVWVGIGAIGISFPSYMAVAPIMTEPVECFPFATQRSSRFFSHTIKPLHSFLAPDSLTPKLRQPYLE